MKDILFRIPSPSKWEDQHPGKWVIGELGDDYVTADTVDGQVHNYQVFESLEEAIEALRKSQ